MLIQEQYVNEAADAALMGKESIFKLAEALAKGIPAQQGKSGVKEGLEQVRQRILDRGGEPVAVGTLGNYRWTALHFSGKPGKFLWVSGVSYTAHEEAYKAGIAAADFAANPLTTREIRQASGKASKDGDPAKVTAGWSIKQQIEAAHQMLADPKVAEALVDDGTMDRATEKVTDARKTAAEKKGGTAKKKAKVREWDNTVINACAAIASAHHAWQEGKWEPQTTTVLAFHMVRQLLSTIEAAPVDDGMLMDDIYTYLEGAAKDERE
jgi:nucleotide-binding universal stress UspA family protein